jgi:hypothetical protein
MTITDYIEKDFPNRSDTIKGFTIGKGKKVYWYISPMPKSGLYRCLPQEKDGSLGWPRFVEWNQVVIPVYK